MVTSRTLAGAICAAALAVLAVTVVAGTAVTPAAQTTAVALRVHPHEGESGMRPRPDLEGYGSLTGSALAYTNTARVGQTSIRFSGTSATYFEDRFLDATASGDLVWSAPIQIPSLPPAKTYDKFLLARAGSKSLASVEVAPKGMVAVRDGTGKLRGTSSVPLNVNTWYHLEAKFSSGAVHVRLFSSTGTLVSSLGPLSTTAGVPTSLRTGLRSVSGPILIDQVSIADSWLIGPTAPSTPPPPTTEPTTSIPPTEPTTSTPPTEPTTSTPTTEPTSPTEATTSTPTTEPTSPPTTSTGPAGDKIIMAAGDIACAPGSSSTATSCRHGYTAQLLAGADHVLALGDAQYNEGTLPQFMDPGAYDGTWGKYKARTHPVPGNHEYRTPEAAGYFDYFGGIAGAPGEGYYSYDVGAWHVIALNTGAPSLVPTTSGHAQEQWLEEDLARHSNKCVLAYWHHPRFSAGNYYPGVKPSTIAFWEDLYAAGADVVLNGHDHAYQRFAPQTPSGAADPQRGISQFVVGTGGRSLYPVDQSLPNLMWADDQTFGVLKMTLRPSSYEWAFVDEAGTELDKGSASCV